MSLEHLPVRARGRRVPDPEARLPFDHDGPAFNYEGLQQEIGQLRAKQIFFIGAMPKSGTTWLQRLLDTHPDVACTGEAHFADRFRPALKLVLEQYNTFLRHKNELELQGLSKTPMMNEDHLHHLLISAIALLMLDAPGGRTALAVGEKTPDNFEHFPLLAALFPRAKFISIVRDPRDCALSAWFHNVRLGIPMVPEKFATMGDFFDFAIQQWARSVARAVRWRNSEPDLFFLLRYEDLLVNPEPLLHDVFEFLGVDSSPEILRRCVDRAAFETMSGGRKAGTKDAGAFLRQGTAGDWRNYFDRDAQRRAVEIAGSVISALNYPTE